MNAFRAVVAGAVFAAVVGFGVGFRWHALVGTEATAHVVATELVRHENTDGSSREDAMPRVRFVRDGEVTEAVVANEYIFATLAIGDALVVWDDGSDVVARDTGNDVLRGTAVAFLFGVLAYLLGALFDLVRRHPRQPR